MRITRKTFRAAKLLRETCSTPGPKYCTECGTPNDAHAAYCVGCGKLFQH